MKTLLTRQEVFEGTKNVYQEDGKSFITVGEPMGRGHMARIKTDVTGEKMNKIFKAIGLVDYFECEDDNGILYIRYYVPDEDEPLRDSEVEEEKVTGIDIGFTYEDLKTDPKTFQYLMECALYCLGFTTESEYDSEKKETVLHIRQDVNIPTFKLAKV